ncbi:MAG TPA: hypothetical protein VK615_12580 [Candidatus Binatia bacterium]|nr:hypothetical protein [Candidatus Binatia bacterium]
MSANEIIAELPKLPRQDLEKVDARLHQLLDATQRDAVVPQPDPVSDQTHVGLEDFPQFPDLHLTQNYIGRDVIYDARGR